MNDSALAAMFSGRHKLSMHNSRIFLDRDGHAFAQLISYLRNGRIPSFEGKREENAFFEELDYWQIPSDLVLCEPTGEASQFDPEWCASTLHLERDNRVVRKHGYQHGIVFSKNPLDGQKPYAEFKITINIPSRNKSHLFVGLVHRENYRPEHLVSTFWRDSPSSYYWDVWSNKLIRTDRNGVQTGVSTSYGCSCEGIIYIYIYIYILGIDVETTIGLEYSLKERTLSFYKNGLDQGVAFRNVANGLYPALDIWFESGHIESTIRSKPLIKEYL